MAYNQDDNLQELQIQAGSLRFAQDYDLIQKILSNKTIRHITDIMGMSKVVTNQEGKLFSFFSENYNKPNKGKYRFTLKSSGELSIAYNDGSETLYTITKGSVETNVGGFDFIVNEDAVNGTDYYEIILSNSVRLESCHSSYNGTNVIIKEGVTSVFGIDCKIPATTFPVSTSTGSYKILVLKITLSLVDYTTQANLAHVIKTGTEANSPKATKAVPTFLSVDDFTNISSDAIASDGTGSYYVPFCLAGKDGDDDPYFIECIQHIADVVRNSDSIYRFFTASQITQIKNVVDNKRINVGNGEEDILTEPTKQVPNPIDKDDLDITVVVKQLTNLENFNSLASARELHKTAFTSYQSNIISLTGLRTSAEVVSIADFGTGMVGFDGTASSGSSGDNTLIDSTATFTVDCVGKIVYNNTTKKSGVVTALVDANNLTIDSGLTFSINDVYYFGVGSIRAELDKLYFNSVLNNTDWTALKAFDSATQGDQDGFTEYIGDNDSGMIKEYSINSETEYVKLNTYNKEIQEQSNSILINNNYVLKVTFSEPTTMKYPTLDDPLTQEIVKYYVRVIKLSQKLSATEQTLCEDTFPIPDYSVVANRKISAENYRTCEKTRRLVGGSIQWSVESDINEFRTEVLATDILMLYIAPITELNVQGEWMAKYINIASLTSGDKTIKELSEQIDNVKVVELGVTQDVFTQKNQINTFEYNQAIASTPTVAQVKTIIANSTS